MCASPCMGHKIHSTDLWSGFLINPVVGVKHPVVWVKPVWDLGSCVLFCRIHYTVNITLVQCVAPAVWFARQMLEPKRREKKDPSAGHNFHWQLVNKLKQRDAGTIFLLFFLLLTLSFSSSSSPVADDWCFPKRLLGSDGLFRCWNLVEGIYHSRVAHSEDFLLRFTHVSPDSSLQYTAV